MARETPALTLGDRIGAAFVGGVIGGVVGCALAWGLGVYSNRLGAGHAPVDFTRWVIGSAGGFAAIGLLFGPVVGTLLGEVISALFAFERGRGIGEDVELPGWLSVLLFIAVVAGVFWWFRH